MVHHLSALQDFYKGKGGKMSTCPLCKSQDCEVYKDRFICFSCKNHIVFYEIPEQYSPCLKMPSQDKATEDKTGRKYDHHWFGVITNTIFCENGVNRVFEGTPQLIIREGDSVFGNEIIFQFIINGEKPSYNAISPINHIEFYLPKEKAIEIFTNIIKFLKEGEK